MPTPFDDLFHFVFQHRLHAAALLRALLPQVLVAAIDWTTLRAANEKVHDGTLRQRITDVLFTVDLLRGGTIWLLLEHKSFSIRELLRQLFRYVALLLDLPPGPGRALPIAVIPVVVYHGPARRQAMAKPPDPVDAALAALQPTVPFVLDDLSLASEEQLRSRQLTPLGTLALLCLSTLRDLDPVKVLECMDRWADLLRAADQDPHPPGGANAVRAIYWYALRVTEVDARELQTTFERILQRPEDQMGTLDRLLREGHERGLAEGKAKGWAEGKLEGTVDGVTRTLTRLLRRRFGELSADTLAKIDGASLTQLQIWTDRLLDVDSIDELLRS